MNESLLKDLNKKQQEAVMYIDGPMIILAGAGSGKTRVLTVKVMYLIDTGKIHPENILMVTFTNKAAQEMKQRIEKMFLEKELQTTSRPFVSTFHAMCAKILRIDGKYIGL